MARPDSERNVGHETRDASVRSVTGFGLAVVLLTAIVLGAMWALFGFIVTRDAARDRPLPPLVEEREALMGPRLQISPARDLLEMRATENEYLNSYGWMDPERGIVRVPIDRAMELLLEKGLPVRESETAAPGEEVSP